MQVYRTYELGFCGWRYVSETFCHKNYSIIPADQCYGGVKVSVFKKLLVGTVQIYFHDKICLYVSFKIS